MSLPRRSTASALRPALKFHDSLNQPEKAEECSRRWLVNGFPAEVLVWTAEEWAMLEPRPVDAQLYPCGVWAALRMA